MFLNSSKFKKLLFAMLFTFVSICSYAHSVAVFIEIGTGNYNGKVRFHALSWHAPSEFGGRPSGSMYVNNAAYAFNSVSSGPIPSSYRLVASCGFYNSYNNSGYAYQSTDWIPGINLCNSMNFNMTSYFLETPACNLSGSVDVSQPILISQPSISPSSTLCAGSNFNIGITASGINLVYQWQYSTDGGSSWGNLSNGNGYSNVTTSQMTYTGVNTNMSNYKYRCFVSSTGSCGTKNVTSNVITITVNPATSITSQPVATIGGCAGTTLSIGVTGSGSNLSYQWQVSNGGSFSNITGATSSSLSMVTGSANYLNGNSLRAVVTGTCGSINSNATVLSVNKITSISLPSTNPSTTTICEGANTNFSVTADGTNVTYQWQVSLAGGSYSNVTNGGVYTNATTNTLNITSANYNMNGAKYRCIVTGSCAPLSLTSLEFPLTVNKKPSIVANPVSQVTICTNSNTSFSVATAGTNLTYQWQVNTDSSSTWNNISSSSPYSISSSATLSTLTITPSLTMHRYRYRCIVSGSCTPSVTSTAGILNVAAPASITVQPSISAVCEGSSSNLSLTATGSNLTYKWQVSTNGGTTYSDISSGANYFNFNTNTLNILGTPSSLNGYKYKGVVTGSCGVPAESNVVTMTVNNLPRITAQPASTNGCVATNPSFSVSATGAGLTYQWQVSSNGGTLYSNILNSNPVYSGATTSNQLTISNNSVSLDQNKYRLILSGTCGSAVTSNAATLSVYSSPSVTISPINTSVCNFGTTYIFLNNSGYGNSYQWQQQDPATQSWTSLSDVKDANGFITKGVTTDSLMLSSVPFLKNGFSYRCQITSVCNGNVTTTPVTLTVDKKPTITLQPVDANNYLNVRNGLNTDLTHSTYIYKTEAVGQFSGVSTIFLWKQSTDGGKTWTSIADGTTVDLLTYSVVNTNAPYTSTLSVTMPNANITKNKYLYRCLIVGKCDVTTTNLVRVNPPPKLNK